MLSSQVPPCGTVTAIHATTHLFAQGLLDVGCKEIVLDAEHLLYVKHFSIQNTSALKKNSSALGTKCFRIKEIGQ